MGNFLNRPAVSTEEVEVATSINQRMEGKQTNEAEVPTPRAKTSNHNDNNDDNDDNHHNIEPMIMKNPVIKYHNNNNSSSSSNSSRRKSRKKRRRNEITTNDDVNDPDKSISLPGVLEQRSKRSDAVTEEDLKHLTSQLGYVPGNAISVMSRREDLPFDLNLVDGGCNNNNNNNNNDDDDKLAPTTTLVYPLAVRTVNAVKGVKKRKSSKLRKRGCERDGDNGQNKDWRRHEHCDVSSSSNNNNNNNTQQIIEPFPTIVWLVCPKMKILISKLEDGDKHNVKAMEARLRKDPHAMKMMQDAHKSYSQLRWSLLNASDREEVSKRNWDNVLNQTTGVAGIRSFDTVKCLHTHTAHYLSGCTDNIVGKWVIQALKEKYGGEST